MGSVLSGAEERTAGHAAFADAPLRIQLLEVARGEIGVQERSGRNDGERVAEYLAYCGLDEGYAWCAAFISWCFAQVGRDEPRTPWSPALFPAARTVSSPHPGDVFGIWIQEKGRIGHAGLVERVDGAYLVTVEGNSNDAVERRRRPMQTIARFADWISRKEGGG